MQSTYTYRELGVRPTQPGERPGTYWSALFMGGNVQNAVSFEFHEEPEHRAIEELMEHLGADRVSVTPPVRAMTRLFFYGTLMPSSGHRRAHVLEHLGARSEGRATLSGYEMFAVANSFPAIVPGAGRVHGEVVEVPAWARDEALRISDMIECYRPQDERWSMYLRRTVQLDDGTTAQAYIWNDGIDDRMPRVFGGDWLARHGTVLPNPSN